MSGQEEADRVSKELGAAISAAVGRDMVVRWAAVVEVIDGQTGDRALWALAPLEATPWDTLGLLGYALERERAGILRDDQ